MMDRNRIDTLQYCAQSGLRSVVRQSTCVCTVSLTRNIISFIYVIAAATHIYIYNRYPPVTAHSAVAPSHSSRLAQYCYWRAVDQHRGARAAPRSYRIPVRPPRTVNSTGRPQATLYTSAVLGTMQSARPGARVAARAVCAAQPAAASPPPRAYAR